MDATNRTPRGLRLIGLTRSWMIAPTVLTALATTSWVTPGCTDTVSTSPQASIEARFQGSTVPIPVPDQAALEVEHVPVRGLARSHTDLYDPEVSRDAIVQALAFPTGRVETSTVLLHQVSPRLVDRAQAFVLEYHVTNLTRGTLDEVEVHLHETENLTLIDCSVHPSLSADTMYWALGRLGPGQTRVVHVSARANQTGAAQTIATVTSRNLLRSQTAVVEPVLEITKSAPAFAARDDVFEIEYTLTNSGTGTARKITIADTLPQGVTTIDDQTVVSFPVLALGPGQRETRTVRVRASRVGVFASPASVTAETGITGRSASPPIEVLDPVLTLSAAPTGPRILESGEHGTGYLLTLTNPGRVVARSPRVVMTLGGARVLWASAPWVQAGDTITFGCDSLAPAGSVRYEIVVELDGQTAIRIEGTADHAETVLSQMDPDDSPVRSIASASRAGQALPR